MQWVLLPLAKQEEKVYLFQRREEKNKGRKKKYPRVLHCKACLGPPSPKHACFEDKKLSAGALGHLQNPPQLSQELLGGPTEGPHSDLPHQLPHCDREAWRELQNLKRPPQTTARSWREIWTEITWPHHLAYGTALVPDVVTHQSLSSTHLNSIRKHSSVLAADVCSLDPPSSAAQSF